MNGRIVCSDTPQRVSMAAGAERSRRGLTYLAVALMLGLPGSATDYIARAMAEAPVIRRVSPLAIAPGTTTTLKLEGAHLEGSPNLWASSELTAVSGSITNANPVQFVVTSATNQSPGILIVQLQGNSGVSNCRLLAIDPVEGNALDEPAHVFTNAVLLVPPCAIDTQFTELKSDFYRIHARAGQTVAVEIIAQRLGSTADPFVRFWEHDGKIMDFIEDSPGIGGDVRFQRKVDRESEFLVEVRDTSHGGGGDFFYRIRADWTFWKGNAQWLCEPEPFNEMARTPAKTLLEKEPNDGVLDAQALSIPGVLTGAFGKAGDVDHFRFPANEGDGIRVVGHARSEGSTAELVFQLLDTNGVMLAESNPTLSDEGLLTHRFKASGDAILQVKELTGQGGDGFTYRLDAGQWPAISISTEILNLEAHAGKEFELTLNVITNRPCAGLKIGIKGRAWPSTVTVTTNKNELLFKAAVPQGVVPGEIRYLRIEAFTSSDSRDEPLPVSTMPGLRKRWPRLSSFPRFMDGIIQLRVIP